MDPLSDEEIRRLRSIAAHSEDIVKEVQYRQAVRLVFGRWRQGALVTTGVLGTLFLLRDQIGAVIEFFTTPGGNK